MQGLSASILLLGREFNQQAHVAIGTRLGTGERAEERETAFYATRCG